MQGSGDVFSWLGARRWFASGVGRGMVGVGGRLGVLSGPGVGRIALGRSAPSTSGGNRTPNRRFWRPVLYQLSYARNRRASESPRPLTAHGGFMEKRTARGGKLAAGRV